MWQSHQMVSWEGACRLDGKQLSSNLLLRLHRVVEQTNAGVDDTQQQVIHVLTEPPAVVKCLDGSQRAHIRSLREMKNSGSPPDLERSQPFIPHRSLYT